MNYEEEGENSAFCLFPNCLLPSVYFPPYSALCILTSAGSAYFLLLFFAFSLFRVFAIRMLKPSQYIVASRRLFLAAYRPLPTAYSFVGRF